MSPPPADRSRSRRSPDNAQVTVVAHKDLVEKARQKAKDEDVALAEVVRDFLAEWTGYGGPRIAGRSDRV